MPSASACRLRFGSLDLRLHARPRYLELFPLHFRLWTTADDGSAPDVELVITDDEEARAPVEHVDDPLVEQFTATGRRLCTSITTLELDERSLPPRASLVIHPVGQDDAYIDHYLAMNVRALLRALGRVQLHGAAVVTPRRTALFLGDKGAGKSTIALAFGRAGAVVLADDQVMLRADDDQIRVSGIDGGLRVTARTERHFFDAPLDATPRDFGGMLKKEVRLGDHVHARPNEDHDLDALYFPRVDREFVVAPLSRSVALSRVLAPLLPLHRFAGTRDQYEFVRTMTRFVRSVEVYELTLGTDLGELDALAGELGMRAS
jgi:hypothetical protein